MTKRDTAPNPTSLGYAPEPGDEWIRVVDLRRKHQKRVFEARGLDGAGVRGVLIDAQYHLLHGVIMLQFKDADSWFRCGTEGWLLMKPPGWTETPPAE